MTPRWIVIVIGLLGSLAVLAASPALPATSAPSPGSEPTTITPPAAEQAGDQPAAAAQPAAPDRLPSLRHRITQWLLPGGVFLMAMVILGFLAISALFASTFWAWFIYLFLLPFLVWMPGMTLHPAVGWVLCAAWLIAFPALRRWLYATPSGKRWLERQRERLTWFEGGDASGATWRLPRSSRSPSSASRDRDGGSSSGFSGSGGRFGGGGSSSRW